MANRKTNSQLSEKREIRYKKIAENGPYGVVLIDVAGKILYPSESYIQMSGYSRDELYSLDIFELSHPDDVACLQTKLQACRVKPDSTIRDISHRVKHKAGHWCWVECSFTNFLNDPDINAIIVNCRDKTSEFHLKEQQHQLITELEGRNEFIETIFQNLPIGIAVNRIDDGKATVVNKCFSEIYGWDEEDLTDISLFFKNVYPDKAYNDKIVQQVMADINSRNPERMQWDQIKITTKGGNTKIVNAKNIPLYDQNLMISTVLDFTREYNQAAELRKTKEEMDKILDSSLDIICALDADGRILRINAAAETLLGYSPAELKGKLLFDYLFEDDKEKTIATAEKTMEGIATRNFINRYRRKDGALIPLSWSAQWDPRDRIRYGVARDATERINYENALLESEKKYKYLFESNPLPILIWDFQTLQILDCNKEAEIKYGYTRDEFLKLSIKDIRPVEDLSLIEAATQSEQSYGQIHRKVWRHKKKNGEFMYMDITGHLITLNGRRVSMALSVDITESRYYAQLDKLEKEILEMHSDITGNFKAMIETYLSGIELIHPGMLCSMEEKKGDRLYNIAAPGLPADFLQSIEGGLIGSHSGSCGTAAFTKKKVIVSDISTDPRWTDYREIAAKSGLKSCWSYPIINSGGEVMATLASYYREKRLPSAMEENTIGRAQHILQVILEGHERDYELYRSNERFEYATQATSDIIWDWNLEDNSVYYSENMTKLFGHPSGVNKDNLPFYYEHVHPDDRERVVLYPDKVKYGSFNNTTQEYRFRKANGEYAYILDKGIVLRDKKGVGKRMVGAIRDISHQKNEEIQKAILSRAVAAALKEKNTILESIADAFFAVDREFNVTYWNKVAEKDLGKTKEEVMGRSLWLPFAPEIGSSSYKNYHLAMNTGEAIHFEDYYETLAKWYEISAYPSENGLSVYFKDITDRKHAEEQLMELNNNLQRQAKELMQSNNELEQFAYVASHDLQEPLRMITSFLTQIENKYNAVLDDTGRRYIHFAVDGAKRMRQIILDLLEFSRVGRTEDGFEEIDLQEVAEEILKLYRKKISEKKAKVIIDQLPVVLSHRGPLRQVFQNLISNALKYSSPDHPPVVEVNSVDFGDYWQISVRDNGLGIDAAYFEKIFVIFQRLHTRDEYSGTGMGLAIAKKIVENLGGRIWLESEPEKGSTFYFTLKKAELV